MGNNETNTSTRRESALEILYIEKLNILQNNARLKAHITNAAKRSVVCEALRLHSKWSDRAIGRECGVDKNTVGKYRRLMTEQTEEKK